MSEAERIEQLDSVINDLMRALDATKQHLADLREECELHIQAVHERDLIIRDLRRDLETLRSDRDTWKAVAQCG